jgi:hypothetical protein
LTCIEVLLMRLPRLRRSTLLVAALLLLLGAWGGAVHWRRHFVECQRRAAYHRGVSEIQVSALPPDLTEDSPPDPETIRFFRDRERHAQLARWYLRAAWRPWLPLPSDPMGSN